MKTVGQFLKEARARKKYSLARLEKETKIKKIFLDAVEKGIWHSLPEFPVVVGFVKKIAKALDISERQSVGFLKRDYPPKALSISPKPDIERKFIWSPKLSFISGVVIVTLVVFSYLTVQFLNFTSPPPLSVSAPLEDEVVKEKTLMVKGKTDSQATVKVNNQPVLVEENGEFTAQIEVFEGTSEITVVAKSRGGKETMIQRKIRLELK